MSWIRGRSAATYAETGLALREPLRCNRFDSLRGRDRDRDGDGDLDGDPDGDAPAAEDSDGDRERRSRWDRDLRRGEEDDDGSRFRWWLSLWSLS